MGKRGFQSAEASFCVPTVYPVPATYSIRPSFCKSQQEFRQPIDHSIHWDGLNDSVWRNASFIVSEYDTTS